MRISPAFLQQTTIAAALCATISGAALASPMQIEAVVSPKPNEPKLEFADGSRRYIVAVQREGKATGSGPLAGATMLEWGVHDVNPASGANANGYLVFTGTGGDVAYLKYQFRGVPVPGADGKPRFMANGVWETTGGTGKFKTLRGTGSVQFVPQERRWVLAGEIVD